MINFEQKINEITNKEDFISFVELLIYDLNNNPSQWNNNTLSGYLGGIANWTDDMEGYYQNNNIPVPENINWKFFANILVAAKMYE